MLSPENEDDSIFDMFDSWLGNEHSNTKPMLDIELKVIVSSGTVLAVRKSNPHQVLWQQQVRLQLVTGNDLISAKFKDLFANGFSNEHARLGIGRYGVSKHWQFTLS